MEFNKETYDNLSPNGQSNYLKYIEIDNNLVLHKILALLEKNDPKIEKLNIELKPLPTVQKRNRGNKAVAKAHAKNDRRGRLGEKKKS